MSTATLHIEKRNTLVPQLRFQEFEGEWKLRRLGEIAKITTGSTPSTLVEEYYNGDKLFVSPTDIQENRYVYKTKTTLTESGFNKGRKIKKGSVLFVCIGSTIGKVAQATEECLTNQQINTLEANKEYENDFLYELLEKNGAKIKMLAGVQAVPQINKTDFSNFKYFIPTLPEQQKIASFLSAVDEKIQQLSRKKELLEQYKKGVMQQLFSGKLRFKDENGEDYADWDIVNIEDLVNRKILDKPLDGNHGNIHPVSSDFVSTGIPFIMANNIRNGILNLDGATCIKKEQADKLQKGFSIEGDVLLTHKGSVGLTAIVQKLETEYIMLTPQVTYYRVIDRQKLNNIFLKTVFDSSIFQKRLQTLADSGTRPYIGITMQRTLEIPFPCLEEQQKIANFLSSIDTKIESTNQQINQTQSFKKGLLQRMFV